MKLVITTLAVMAGFPLFAQSVPVYSVASVNNYNTITCAVKQISLSVVTSYTGPLTYVWTGPGFNAQTAAVTLTTAGNYSLTLTSGTVTTNTVVAIGINTVMPICTPASLTFTSANAMTITAISPTNNITHYIYEPYSPFVTTSTLVTCIFNTTPGTYTHCLVNNLNGCNTCSPAVVVNPSTGTGPVLPENTLTAFSCHPNPTDGVFKITPYDPEITTIEVYTTAGEQLKVSYTLTPGVLVDLGNAPAGIYVVVLTRKNGSKTKLRVFRL